MCNSGHRELGPIHTAEPCLLDVCIALVVIVLCSIFVWMACRDYDEAVRFKPMPAKEGRP